MLPLRETRILSYLHVIRGEHICSRARPQPSYGWLPSVHPADTLNQYQSSLIFSWSPKYQALRIPLQCVSNREEIKPCCAHAFRYLWDRRGGFFAFF